MGAEQHTRRNDNCPPSANPRRSLARRSLAPSHSPSPSSALRCRLAICFRVRCKTFRWQCNEDEHEDEPTEGSNSIGEKILLKILTKKPHENPHELPLKKLQQKNRENGVCTCLLFKFEFVRIYVRIFRRIFSQLNYPPDSEDHENQRLRKNKGAQHVVKKTYFINTCIAL